MLTKQIFIQNNNNGILLQKIVFVYKSFKSKKSTWKYLRNKHKFYDKTFASENKIGHQICFPVEKLISKLALRLTFYSSL